MNRIHLSLALLCLLMAVACQPSIEVSTPTPSPEPTAPSVPPEPTDTPGPVGPTITPSTQTSQVTGAVLLEDGRCCVGGIEGSTVNIKVTFEAQSLAGEVTDMRVARTGGGGKCLTESEMNTVPWETLAAEKTYPFGGIPINWIGWYVSVQYRDTQGNLSPVYCDDISIEGMPRPPTAATP